MVAAALLGVAVSTAPKAKAATFNWNQTAAFTYSWTTSANWDVSPYPNAIGDVANLSSSTVAQIVNLDAVITIGGLNFGAQGSGSTNGYTLAAGTGGLLILDDTDGAVSINKLSGSPFLDIISADIQFNDALTISNNSGGGTLTLGTMRSLTSDVTLTGSGAVPAGSIVLGAISTAGGLIKDIGLGIAQMSVNTTYAGTTWIKGGRLIANSGVSIPIRSAITIDAGAVLESKQNSMTWGSIAGAGNVTITSGTRNITIGRDDTSTSFSGTITSTTPGGLSVTKIGAGTLTLQPAGSNQNTYTGITTVSGGNLVLDTSSSSRTSAFWAATPLTISGGNFELKGRSAQTLTQTLGAFVLGATGGSITLTPNSGTSTNLAITTLQATASGGALLITSPTGTTFNTSSLIASTALNGRLVFNDGTANTYNWAYNNNTAATAVSGFLSSTTLPSTGGGAVGTSYILTAGQDQGTANATIGTLKLSSTSGTTQVLDLKTFNMQLGGGTTSTPGAILIDGTANWNINGSTGLLTNNTPGTSPDLIFQHYGTGTVTVNAGIGGATALALVKAGTGTLVLAGTNAFTGAIFVNGGVLSFSNVTAAGAGSLGNGSATAVTIRDGATLKYTGATGIIAATGAGGHTFLLAGGNANIEVTSAAAELTLSGVISGAGGYTKLGDGTLVIGVSSTFTGPLSINAGTLKPSGSIQISSSSSPVTIGTLGTLDLNGTSATQTMTIGSLSGAGTVKNSGASGKTLSVGGDNTSTTFSGTFSSGGGSNANALTKLGSGVFTLTSSTRSVWTSGSNINGGILRLGASDTLSTSGTTVIANAPGPAALELNANVTQTIAALTFYGTGTTTTSQGSVLLGSSSTLTLGGSLSVVGSQGPLGVIVSGAGSLALSGNRTFEARDSATVPTSDYELTVTVPISGASTLTTTGTGNVLLAGNNTYAGISTSNTSATGKTVLTGDNSGATGTTTVSSGILLLDYTTSNTAKISTTGALSLLGGTLTLNGNGSAATSQAVASTTFAAGSFATVNMNPGAGQSLVLDLKALTRAAGAGTVRFNLSGTQSLTNGVLTTATNDATTGLLGTGGGWATVTIGGATNFATASGGFITAITPTTLNDLSTLSTTSVNLTDSTGYTGTLGRDTTLNSIRFNGSGASAITIPAGSQLRIDSGGILQTSGVGGTTTISGGRLVGNVGSELIFTTDSLSQTLSVSSAFSGATVITKTGVGTLALSGINSLTSAMNLQGGTVNVSGGFAIGDTQNLNFNAQGDGTTFTLSSGSETVGNLTGGSSNFFNTSTQHGISTVTIGSGATLIVNQFTAGLTYGGVLSGAGTFVKSGTGDLTLPGNSSTSFTGPLVINQGQVRLAGNGDGTGRIGSTVISVNNAGSELRINHDNNNAPDRIINAAVITLNNTAPGLGLFFRDSHDSSRGETIGTVNLGAGHNVIAADANNATRFGTLTLGAAAATVIGRTNNATTLVVGRNLGSVAYGSVTAATLGGRITFTNTPTGVNATVGGAGADGTSTASIFPYMIGQATSGAPTLTDVGNSFVRYSSNGLRPLSTTAADAEYVFEAAGFNALAASTTSNVRFTVTPGAALNASSASPRTINSLVIDSTLAAVTVTGPAADTLALTSGAFLSTGTAANNTALTGFAGITTATNNEYIFFVTNTQFTLGSPLTTTAAALTKSGAGAMILNGLTTNAYTGGTFFNQGLIEASALTNLGPSGGLNFFGGGLRWATSTTFDISGRTVTVGTGGAVLDTNGNNVSFANAIGNSGAGGVTKNGNGTLTLSGANTFTGASTINAGRLQLDGGDNRLATAAGVTLTASASLQLGGTTAANQTITELVGVATNSVVGGNASVSTLTVNQGRNTSYLGFIGGAGTNENSIALVKQGSGILTLGAVASTFTGGLTIQAGTVSAGNNNNTFGGNGNVITLGHSSGSSDATLYVSPSASRTLAQPITVAAGSTGALAIVSDYGATGVATFSGAVTVNNNVILSKIGVSTGDMIFTGGFSTSAGTGKNITIKNNGSPASGGSIVLSGTAVNNTGAIINNGNGTAGVTISADIGSSVTNLTQNSATSALTLSGDNSFSGGTTVSAGTVRAGHDNAFGNLAAHAIALNGGTLTSAGGTARTFANNVTIGGNITLGATTTNTGVLTFNGTVGLGAAVRTITVNSDVTFAGIMSAGGLTKAGAGTLTLSGNNVFTLGTTLSAGTLILNHVSALGTGAVTVNGGTLDLNTSNIAQATNVITVTSGSVIGGLTTASVDTAGSPPAVTAVLTGAGGLTKTTAGTLTITTANFHTGATVANVAGAIIRASHLADTGSSLGASALDVPANLVLGLGAKLEFTGGTATSTTRSFTVGGTAGIVAGTGAGTLEFTSASKLATTGTDPELTLTANNAAAGSNRFDGTLASGSNPLAVLAIDGTGTWVIAGNANRFRGDIRFEAGAGATLGFETGSLGLGGGYSTSVIQISHNAVLVWSGANTDDISSRLRIPTGATAKMNLGSNNVEFAAAPTNASGAAITNGTIQKSGAGTLKIASTVTSPGLNFDVPAGAGKLTINGTVGNVTLASGTTLGGVGHVGTVTAASGSTISPGNSPGILYAESMTLDAPSTFLWEVQDALAGPGVGGYDKLVLTTSLDLTTATANSKITIKINSLTADGVTIGNATNFGSPNGNSSLRTFQFASVQTGANGVLLGNGLNISDVFQFDVTDFRYTGGGLSNASLWSIDWNSGTGAITLTAVPEPSTYGFGLGALALAAAAIRRRRKNQPKA